MVQYNHVKVLANIKKLFSKGSADYQLAEELQELLMSDNSKQDLYENEFFNATMESLKSDIFERLNTLVADDAELRASVSLYRRFMSPEDTERLVRKHLEEYLDETQLAELST